MVSVSVCYLFFQLADDKIKIWTHRFSVKENPNMGKSIVCISHQQPSFYSVRYRKLLFSKRFSPGIRCIFAKPTKSRARLCLLDKPIKLLINIILFRLLFWFCSCVIILRSNEIAQTIHKQILLKTA